MKKIFMFLAVTVSFLGIGSVKAADLPLSLELYSFNELKSEIGSDNFNNIIDSLLLKYKNNYISSYPYYDIQIDIFNISVDSEYKKGFMFILNLYDKVPSMDLSYSYSPGFGITSYYFGLPKNTFYSIFYYYEDGELKSYDYNFSLNKFNLISMSNGENNSIEHYSYYPYTYYISNYNLYLFKINSYKNKYDSSLGINLSNSFLYNYDNLLIPNLNDSNYNVVSYDLEDFLIEPYYLYDEEADFTLPQYTEINLNDYAYVALSLKDYNQDPFDVLMRVKGQYCITPVYNYGMTERKDILSGTQVERCSPYYDSYTPIRTYILDSDLKNHAIYYLKSYDTSKDNYVKIDTTIFDVTLITEEEKDSPYVTVNGKTYPTISYDDLTDTATKSEDEGYASGASEKFTFSDIFTAPLEFFKDIWNSVISVFDLVNELFSLLPEPLPTFLIISFTLALALGLIKIIL